MKEEKKHLDGTETPFLCVKKEDSIFSVYRKEHADGTIEFTVTAEKPPEHWEKDRIYANPNEKKSHPVIAQMNMDPREKGKMSLSKVRTERRFSDRGIQKFLASLQKMEAQRLKAKSINAESTAMGKMLYEKAGFKPIRPGSSNYVYKVKKGVLNTERIKSVNERDELLAKRRRLKSA